MIFSYWKTNGVNFYWSHGRRIMENNITLYMLVNQMYLFSVLFYSKEIYTKTPRVSRWPGRVWNAGWAVFSAAGFLYTWPSLSWLANDVLDSCQVSEAQKVGTPVWWLYLYVFTKPLEFVDTLLLMLRGRPIKLLHWSHHWITALYVVYATYYELAPTILFASLNYGVHACMYTYYCLVSFSALRETLKKYAYWLTRLQMGQFVCALTSLVAFWHCYTRQDLVITGCMYSYYLYLFARMYQARFRDR